MNKISKFDSLILQLKERFAMDNLPGKIIQYELAPPGRSIDIPKGKTVTDSSVAILLYEKENQTFFVLIKRTSFNGNDKHKGQISFPGGRYDKNDITLDYCALRELEEEIGVNKKTVYYLGKLTSLYIPVSNFMVYPFVFYLTEKTEFIPQQSEVEYILEVNLNDLLDDKNLKFEKVKQSTFSNIANMPYFALNNEKVWGATAMILNEFKNVVRSFKTN